MAPVSWASGPTVDSRLVLGDAGPWVTVLEQVPPIQNLKNYLYTHSIILLHVLEHINKVDSFRRWKNLTIHSCIFFLLPNVCPTLWRWLGWAWGSSAKETRLLSLLLAGLIGSVLGFLAMLVHCFIQFHQEWSQLRVEEDKSIANLRKSGQTSPCCELWEAQP